MTYNNNVRTKTGIAFFLFHFSMLLTCIFFKMADLYDELTLACAMALLSVLLVPYTPRIFKLFIRSKYEFEKGRPVNKRYSLIVLSLLGFFMLLVATITIKQAIYPSSLITFIESLALVEVIFTIYIESIISDLFEQEQKDHELPSASGAAESIRK